MQVDIQIWLILPHTTCYFLISLRDYQNIWQLKTNHLYYIFSFSFKFIFFNSPVAFNMLYLLYMYIFIFIFCIAACVNVRFFSFFSFLHSIVYIVLQVQCHCRSLSLSLSVSFSLSLSLSNLLNQPICRQLSCIVFSTDIGPFSIHDNEETTMLSKSLAVHLFFLVDNVFF